MYYVGILDEKDLFGEPIEIREFRQKEERLKEFDRLIKKGKFLTFGDTFLYTEESYIPALKEKVNFFYELGKYLVNEVNEAQKDVKEQRQILNENLKIFGLPDNSLQSEIDKKFRQLSLKLHPDKNKAKDATQKYQELGNTKDLIDKAKKTISKANDYIIRTKKQLEFYLLGFDYYSKDLKRRQTVLKNQKESEKKPSKNKPEMSPKEIEERMKVLSKMMETELSKGKNKDENVIKQIRAEINKLGLANLRLDDDDDNNDMVSLKTIEEKLKKLSKPELYEIGKTKTNIIISEKFK